MRFTVLSSDYDGTLATHGELHAATLAALWRVAGSGRKLVLVTGRTLEGLRFTCPDADVFDFIVAENGAVLHDRDGASTRILAPPLPDQFAAVCRAHDVPEMHVGQVIASTWIGYRDGVVAAQDELGLNLDFSYNKGSLMVMPPGVDKASGLSVVLTALDKSPEATVALGDAENDLPLLDMCGCAVAVANALAVVKRRADIVTVKTHGEGAAEVLDALVDDELASMWRNQVRRAC